MRFLQNVESVGRNVATNTLVPYMNAMMGNLVAADKIDQVSRPIPAPRTNCRETGSQDYTCRLLNSVDNGVALLRTSAVKVMNPNTGKSTLAYAQHDTASQVTLISAALRLTPTRM